MCSYTTFNATNILHQHDKNALPRIIFTVFWNNSDGPFTSFYIHQILKSLKSLPTELRGQAHRLLGWEHTGSVLRWHRQLFIRLGDSSKLFFTSAGHPNTLANGIFRKSLQRPRQHANLTQQLCELGHMDLHRGKFSKAKYFTLKPQSAISQICKQV